MTAIVVILPAERRVHPMDLDWKTQISAENRAYHMMTRMDQAPARSRPQLVTIDGERVK